MTPRERLQAALGHRQPDRVPVDFGATAVTGMHVTVVAALRRHFGLEPRPVKVCEPFQMLGAIEPDLAAAMALDAEGIGAPDTLFGFPNENWREFTAPWGQALLVSEHFHPWVDDVGASGFAFATLGAMARATHRVRLATGVITPLFRYHPAVVAQAAATIDRLSGGRFDLGVGTGENINEAPVGLPFPPYGERARRLAEAREIIRRLLDGEKVTFPGRYYQTDRARLYSPPLGRVAIWMAAGGPQSAALAAT